MMFRLAYPVLLILLIGVIGWLVFALLKKPIGITHSMTSRLAELAKKGSGSWQRIPLVLRAACLILLVSMPMIMSTPGDRISRETL